MDRTSLDRRTMLEALAVAAGTGFLAGCSGSSDDDSSGDENADDSGTTDDGSDDGSDTDDGSDDGTDDSNGDTDDGEDPAAGDVDREITVESESFKFTPGTEEPLVVQQGQTIELTATAVDNGIGQGHGLGIPAFDVNLAPVFTDEPKTTTFVADEAGEFDMLCTIQCSQPNAGEGHSNMTGTFIVESA